MGLAAIIAEQDPTGEFRHMIHDEVDKWMVTMQGPSVLKRPWFYCVDCSYGFSPLDKALEISRKNISLTFRKNRPRPLRH